MDLQETMRELEQLGSEATRKAFLRLGAPRSLFGVELGDLEKLRKRIQTNAGLAEALWDSGNADARMLATMVADAAAMSWMQLDAWARSLDWHSLADAFVSNVAVRSQHARKAVEAWTAEPGEMLARAGWQLLAALTAKTQELKDEELAPWLERIEQGIHSAQSRVREAMNAALIAIGSRGGALQAQALAVAQRIGKVVVDHGDTEGGMPDAAEHIARAQAQREGAAGRAATLAKNAVGSVKDAAKRAAVGAQSVASGAMSSVTNAVSGAKDAVANATHVVADVREAVTSATHAVSDVARNAVANARNVASGVVGKRAKGNGTSGAQKSAPKGNGAAKHAAAKGNGAAKHAATKGNGVAKHAAAKGNGVAKKASAKANGGHGAAKKANAKRAAVKRAAPATAKKAAGKQGAARKAAPGRAKTAGAKRAAPATAKTAAKRAAPARGKKAVEKAPARGRTAAKKAPARGRTAAKKMPARGKTAAKKSARPRA